MACLSPLSIFDGEGGRGGEAEGAAAPEEFPKVFFTVSYEDMASLKGPADRVWGHDPGGTSPSLVRV